MKLYLKGNYETSIYQDSIEYPWKMWFKKRKGIQLGFSYARDDDFYFSVSLDKFSFHDERWKDADFKNQGNLWKTFYYENLDLCFEKAYESDGREKGDYLRILSSHVDILTVDKRAMYIMALEVATAINGQISEDDKETWLTVEEFKERHQEILSLTYDETVDLSLKELQNMDPIDEPLWEELDRRRDEYIKLHGERVYEYEDDDEIDDEPEDDDDEEDEELDDETDDDGEDTEECYGF